MPQPNIQLDFKCQKKWSDMTPQGNGRFCSNCQKVVTDFTKTKANYIVIDAEQEACGNFYAHQLYKPFNDWRDNIITLYQKTTFRLKNNKLLKPITAFFLIILLVVTGCIGRTRGKVAPKNAKRFNRASETTETKK